MGLQAVLDGLAEAAIIIDDLRVYDFPSPSIQAPAIVLLLPTTPFDVTLGGGSDQWVFPIWLLVSKADQRSGYNEMVPYLEAEGERSVRQALEADKTLGGACDTLSVLNARPQTATVAGTDYLAIEFTLEVYT